MPNLSYPFAELGLSKETYRPDESTTFRNGSYINPFSSNKYLHETAQKILGMHITTHALQHTHISSVTTGGIDIESIFHS